MEREGGREGKKEREGIFHLLAYSSNAYNSQDLARSKPGAQNSICVAHMGGKDSVT